MCLLLAGAQYAARHRSLAHFGLMFEFHGTRYLGAAHGLAGICHTLLLCPRTVRTLRLQDLCSLTHKNPEAPTHLKTALCRVPTSGVMRSAHVIFIRGEAR